MTHDDSYISLLLDVKPTLFLFLFLVLLLLFVLLLVSLALAAVRDGDLVHGHRLIGTLAKDTNHALQT